MRELRKDPLLGRWVIVATERAERPYDFHRLEAGEEPECPYCEPGEKEAGIRSLSSASPVVSPAAFRTLSGGLRTRMSASGDHEVIVESGRHGRAFEDLGSRDLARVIGYWAERFRAHAGNTGVAYAVLYKEQGVPEHRGDAAVRHARSEIVSLPVVPKRAADELDLGRRHFRRTGRCLFCRLVAEERRRALRVVARNASFIAIAPYASHSPFEIAVFPLKHAADFHRITPRGCALLAEILRGVLRGTRRAIGPKPYYFALHTAPFGRPEPSYHWHVEIAPRTFFAAGFEWGGGVYINPVTPEDAAKRLRAAMRA